ncbi:MAG: LysR family transcriptional regulator [Phenylobacterium sp.]|uniref:LysR family transcriptional regulator n=1 Tax=Phenylobacterium sp. TaxID=1871053 RepID=UPI001A3AC43E|nr:LysR family transcriptional regulator [Phenylobacterium sp.]MBL8771555.1 LysR family transcriptional regulator [Phenylobacterium sp.]
MRHVLAIHRAGSFARAADDLGLAQSTLSKSIARLEDQLGLRLFERSGSGAEPTPMGLVVVARAGRIIDEAERLQRDVELAAAGEAGEVRIGLGPALRPAFMPPFAEALVRRWPRLKVTLDVGRRERVIEDFRAGRFDMVIAARAAELETPDLVSTEILREPVVALAAPGHPLALLRSIAPDEFLAHPHVAASAVSMLTAPGAATEVRPTLPDEPQIQCSDEQAVIAVARAGLATAFLPRHIAAAEIEAGRLVVLPLRWRMTIRLMATTTKAARSSPLIQEILRTARQVADDLSPA